MGPDVFYVEKAQEILQHLQKIGISALASKWVVANARPEVVLFDEQSTVKSSTRLTENLLGLMKAPATQHPLTKASSSTLRRMMQEISPTLVPRASGENTLGATSDYTLRASEESLFQGTGALSEMSDETAPILGRRALRESISVTSKYSDDSDLDLGIYRSDKKVNHIGKSDMQENLLEHVDYIATKVLTSGEKNYLLHYVHLDSLEGIFLSSAVDRNLSQDSELMLKFSSCAYVIHRLLQNTVRYKKMLNQGMGKSVINKSLIAIKEHGVLFYWNNMPYWIVGRMYSSIQSKEVYACYQDSAPQNLVEMIFRLHSFI